MNDQQMPLGILLLADSQGVVEEIVRDELGVSGIKPGRLLADSVDEESREKARRFLFTLKADRVAFGWEMNVPMDGRIVTLHFAGGASADRLFLFGSPFTSAIAQFYQAMVEMVGGRTEQVRDSLLRQSGKAVDRLRHDAKLFDDLSELNNQLVNTQRQLTAKNAELLRVQKEVEQAKAEVEVRLRAAMEESLRIQDEMKKAKETAESANRAKDRFLGVLSHELRTPLTSMLLTVSLLKTRDDLPPEVQEDIETIHRNALLEVRLIDDLLDLTRIAHGKFQFHFENTDLHQLIHNAADIFTPDRGARIVLDLKASRRRVHGDPARLQQVLWNLLSNARKFTPAAGTITVRSQNADPNRIYVEVIDTGIGIEPQSLSRIFQAFEQGDAGKASHLGGLGLGLAISKMIVETHHGALHAHSDGKERGSTFTVELPVTE